MPAPRSSSGLPEPEAPENTTLPQHADELERKLTALGPVNPLALEELSQLEERHKELEAQVDDVRGARRELHEVVRTLDHEIMTSFAAAAADVNEHFSTLIAMLFPGGTGRLMLIDPDDLLNTGVEIEVRPAGRNVRRVSLLSGGERSMAALAFLFAVFRSRPSPFYMMDEVEAALDDVNLSRFLALVHEFRDEAQLLIVSHQKRTMETGDALYGVTMAPGGSSQVVSQKVEGVGVGVGVGVGQGGGVGVIGTILIIVIVVVVLAWPPGPSSPSGRGGVAVVPPDRSRRRRRRRRHDRRQSRRPRGRRRRRPVRLRRQRPPRPPPTVEGGARTGARPRTDRRGATVVPQPPRRRARPVRRRRGRTAGGRASTPPRGTRSRRPSSGPTSASPRRTRCWPTCAPRWSRRRSAAATTCWRPSATPSASCSRPPAAVRCASTAGPARPTCG